MARLKDIYNKDIVPALQEKFQLKSVMQVPRVTKICINRGIGAAVADKKLVDNGVEELTVITGQKAIATIACQNSSGGLVCFVTRFRPSTMTRWVTRFTDLITPDLPFSSPAITFTVSPDFTCSCTGSAFLIAMI